MGDGTEACREPLVCQVLEQAGQVSAAQARQDTQAETSPPAPCGRCSEGQKRKAQVREGGGWSMGCWGEDRSCGGAPLVVGRGTLAALSPVPGTCSFLDEGGVAFEDEQGRRGAVTTQVEQDLQHLGGSHTGQHSPEGSLHPPAANPGEGLRGPRGDSP